MKNFLLILPLFFLLAFMAFAGEGPPMVGGNPPPVDFAAAVRTNIARKLNDQKIELDKLRADRPGTENFDKSKEYQILYRARDNTILQETSDDWVMADASSSERWYFSRKNALLNIGSPQPEILAITDHIKPDACEKINAAFAIKDLPPIEKPNLENLGGEKNTPITVLDTKGQVFGCFNTGDGKNYYIHMLVEQ